MLQREFMVFLPLDRLKKPISRILTERKSIKQWAYALHMHDEDIPHYHLYLNFGDKQFDNVIVASWFNVSAERVKKILGSTNSTLEYLSKTSETVVVSNFDF